MFDLLIRGGTVIDGTGVPGTVGDVAVRDGVIVDVGQVVGRARRVIDADGLLVTPGFVDIHTHYDGQVTWDPHLTPSCWHGVTTAILGNCGVGFAPARHDDHQFLIELMEGVEDIPGTALHDGIQWEWETFAEYLDAIDRTPRAVDVGTQVPHAAVRAFVMGHRAGEDATEAEIDTMHDLVVEALRAGALGFSTGRTTGHRDVHGHPVPGTFAAEEELDRLVAALGEAGHGVFQVVPRGIGGLEGGDPEGSMDAELEWILRLAQETKVPTTFLVMESAADPDGWRPWFDRVRLTNARGAQLRPQVGSRCFGALLGHQSSMNPFRHSRTYAGMSGLPHQRKMDRLADPGIRTAILGDIRDGVRSSPELSLDRLSRATFGRVFPLGDPMDYEPTADRSVAAIAERQGRDPWAVTYDLLLDHQGRDFLLFPLLNYGTGSYDGLYDMINDPMTVQGLGDGGAHTAMICDASMTTYLLSHWARDRARGPKLPLETVVRRLTGDPAELYRLDDRGTIRPGLRADINVIDFAGLRLVPPEQLTDLPAGAPRLVQRAEGYVETLVAGETVVADGECTDARPGHLVRGGVAL